MSKPSESRPDASSSGVLCPECHRIDSFQAEIVEESVSVGMNTALVPVEETVCQVCGYKLLNPADVRKIEDVHERLTRADVAGMQPVGTTYHVQG